ncbi:MAG: sugar phosphate isomerase/epimerase [Chitinophagia bacterium]|nr:sugar phosphate isomerase/epimerase [Chitinophagia bacterium]
MSINRRLFVKNATLAATAGLSLPLLSKAARNVASLEATAPLSFGIQLWTVKEDMGSNAKDTLAKLAGYGYNQIESFEGPKGMFWGWKHTEFKKYMDDLGMKIISSHCNHLVNFEQKAAEAAEIGMEYLICPWKGPQKNIDGFKKAAEEFNKAGEICNKNGIRFAYHNHDYSFKPIDGLVPQEVMMKESDKNLVDFEMDIYWVVAAGEDPMVWFKKFPGRFKLCHVKDLKHTDKGHESVQIGKGNIDFPTVLKAGSKAGVTKFIIEQEAFTGTNPLESAVADAGYMRGLRL